MEERYYIVYNPLTFDCLDMTGETGLTPEDLISVLSCKDISELNEHNYLSYLYYNMNRERPGLVEELGLENYGSFYIANRVSISDPEASVYLCDGKRRMLPDIIKERGTKPEAVFITSISANFPAAVLSTIVLNHASIPVVIGGIHVSSSPDDVDIFIRPYLPYPNLVAQVNGPGDSHVISSLINDLSTGSVKDSYTGKITIEDGAWGSEKVIGLPPVEQNFLKKLPLIGRLLIKRTKGVVSTPFLGCPFSCRFCSISSVPEAQRKLVARSPEDFVNEMLNLQKDGADFSNRFYLWLPDNLMLGGKKLHKILDCIIESDLKINYAAQVSIDIANDTVLLAKLRESGLAHLFIGLESLDLRNLESINKNIVNDIRKSGLSVAEYYSEKLKIIRDSGIGVHGAFMFGMPYDYLNSPDDHTGIQIADFCLENRIGIQPSCYNDLPGSLNFNESQDSGTWLYGRRGTMDYLLSLCTADLTESNRQLPPSVKESAFAVTYMAYDVMRRIGTQSNAVKLAIYTSWKSFLRPTSNGKTGLRERFCDCIGGAGFQLGATTYLELYEGVICSRPGVMGTFERLYKREKNEEIREMFADFVPDFMCENRQTEEQELLNLKN